MSQYAQRGSRECLVIQSIYSKGVLLKDYLLKVINIYIIWQSVSFYSIHQKKEKLTVVDHKIDVFKETGNKKTAYQWYGRSAQSLMTE